MPVLRPCCFGHAHPGTDSIGLYADQIASCAYLWRFTNAVRAHHIIVGIIVGVAGQVVNIVLGPLRSTWGRRFPSSFAKLLQFLALEFIEYGQGWLSSI